MDWKQIKAEYIAGGTSYRKLAEKYNVPFGTLRRIAKQEAWTQKRAQVEQRVNTKIVETVSEKSAKIDEKFFCLVDKLFDKAEAVIDNTPVWQVNSIKEMASALKYLKDCKGVKSEADIREQEARIAKLQREAEKEDTLETPTLVVEGLPEEFKS